VIVGVPALIVVVALGGGIVASTRVLPRLADDRVGRLSFWTVCLLLGIAVALVALDVYGTVRAIDRVGGIGGTAKSDVLASGLSTILDHVGPVLGVAAAVYLLAPSGEPTADEQTGDAADA
jgi:hypothetical protein